MLTKRANRSLIARAKARLSGERGALLIEVLIAISVLTLLGSAVMTGTSTSKRAASTLDISATAQNLGRNQMETILSTAYQDPPYSYTPISAPAGYAITADAEEYVVSDVNIAKIVVVVTLDGVTELALETLRVKE